MDYGVYLKKELKINNKKSKHYSRQSKFQGSRRQVRGAIIRILSKIKKISEEDLCFLVHQEIPEN
jgi:A/G-specific adenine glycosylase